MYDMFLSARTKNLQSSNAVVDTYAWWASLGRCISTNAAIEGEAKLQADELNAKAGSTCMGADKQEDCSAVTLAENNS